MYGSGYEKIENNFYIDKRTCKKIGFNSESHYHNSYEVFYILQGEVKYFIHDQCYRVRKGDLVFVDTYEIHKALYVSEDCERIVILFRPSFIEANSQYKAPDIFSILNSKFNGSRLITPPQPLQYELETLTYKMFQLNDSDSPYAKVYQNSYFTIFLTQIADYLNSADKISKHPSKNNSKIRSILSYLNDNFEKELTLDAISQHFNMSKFHLCRFFKEYTGLSVIDYVNRKRIINAERLITSGDHSITDISSMVGFNNLTHFERVFKSTTGISPRKYKKLLNQ